MALHWSWAFGNETTTDLIAMGWAIPSTANVSLTSATDEVYTYTGSTTRYGWKMRVGSGSMYAPPEAVSGLTDGWAAVPVKALDTSAIANNQNVLRVVGADAVAIYVNVTSGSALSLYVANQFKETTASIDWTSWKYVSLKWDFGGVISAGKWSAQLYVDGVAVTALQEHTRAASTAALVQIGSGPGRAGQLDCCYSQMIVWGSSSDAGETPYYVTRADVTADGTNVGTWTASSGGADYVDVASPFDAATYTQDATPSASDRCEVVSSTIATALGITPGTVAGVTGHTFSEGQAVTAKAVVGPSGGAETSGSNVTISASSTTYAMATSTAAFTGSDTIDVIYEVVST